MKDRWLQEEDYIILLFLTLVIAFSIIIVIKINYPELNDKREEGLVNIDNNSKQYKIIINEVSIYPEEAIELYNDNDIDVNLNGYILSDKSGKTYKFPNKIIPKKGYLVITNSELGFDINNSNEIIKLNNKGLVVDSFNVNKLVGNISTGIDNGRKVYYKTTTLGSKNSSNVFLGFSAVPEFSVNGGYAKVGDKVSLSTKDNSTIYYTIDGSFPTNQSNRYNGPITINKNTIIKAISYRNGYIESDVVSRTFITDRVHDIPFVSISTDSLNFYNNYTKKEEQKMNFEYYERNGIYGISFIGDVKVSGWGTTKLPQKNLGIYLRKKYGVNKLSYPFFQNITYPFSSLLLRGSGNDYDKLHIKEGVLSNILDKELDLDKRTYQPVAVYLNGEYWGIYSLMEKLNADYLENKYNIDKKNIDLIKYYVDVFDNYKEKQTMVNGNKKEFANLLSYLDSHDVTDTNVYNYLKTQIDIQNIIDFWIAKCFYSDRDYPYNNIKIYKSPNGKWRWMLYDLDWCEFKGVMNEFLFLNIKSSVEWVKIINKLKDNSEFREQYLMSLGKYLKTTFKPDRVKKILDEKTKEIEKEMPYHLQRWGSNSFNASNILEWKNDINSLKSKYEKHYNDIVRNLKVKFNLNDSEYNKYFGGL